MPSRGPGPRRSGTIGDDLVDRGVDAVTQRHVGQDLGGGADHRSDRVDDRVAGDQSDAGGAELGGQVEELLRHQRLDGGGVVGAPPFTDGRKMSAERHERLARPVGVVTITCEPPITSSNASSW